MRGGWPPVPRPIEQALFCLPIGYIAYTEIEWYYALVVYAISVGMCLKGHGNNMDLGTWKKKAEYEDYEKWTGWYKLRGKLSEYWYDVGGIGISGLIVTLPLIFINPLMAFSGLLKAPAYMIGWALHPNGEDGKLKFKIYKFTVESATEWGELLTGVFIWFALIGLYLLKG